MLQDESVVAWRSTDWECQRRRSAEVVGLRMLRIVRRSEQAFALEKLQPPGERTDFNICYLKIDKITLCFDISLII